MTTEFTSVSGELTERSAAEMLGAERVLRAFEADVELAAVGTVSTAEADFAALDEGFESAGGVDFRWLVSRAVCAFDEEFFAESPLPVSA